MTGIPGWTFSETQRKRLDSELIEWKVVRTESKEEFLFELPDTDIALIWYFKEEWFSEAKKLKALICPAAGRDFFQKMNIPKHVSLISSGFHGEIMAETVLGMMLSHARGISTANSLIKEHQWPRAEIGKRMRRFRGSKITILGFGNIGQWVARLAKPFGPIIRGVKRTKTPLPSFLAQEDSIHTMEELDSLLPDTDHLVLVLPKAAETDNIINNDRLSLLPKDSAIYNIGRGNAVDEAALVTALAEQRISAAYMDVFHKEPLPMDSPLRKARNCYIYPHSSAISPDYLDLFLDETIPKIRELERGL